VAAGDRIVMGGFAAMHPPASFESIKSGSPRSSGRNLAASQTFSPHASTMGLNLVHTSPGLYGSTQPFLHADPLSAMDPALSRSQPLYAMPLPSHPQQPVAMMVPIPPATGAAPHAPPVLAPSALVPSSNASRLRFQRPLSAASSSNSIKSSTSSIYLKNAQGDEPPMKPLGRLGPDKGDEYKARLEKAKRAKSYATTIRVHHQTVLKPTSSQELAIMQGFQNNILVERVERKQDRFVLRNGETLGQKLERAARRERVRVSKWIMDHCQANPINADASIRRQCSITPYPTIKHQPDITIIINNNHKRDYAKRICITVVASQYQNTRRGDEWIARIGGDSSQG
jgi:hypothetical protein